MRDEVPESVVPRMQTAAIGRAWQERLARWVGGLIWPETPLAQHHGNK